MAEPRQRVSSWATGASELGWGDGDEATVIPGTAITQYFVRDFTSPTRRSTEI